MSRELPEERQSLQDKIEALAVGKHFTMKFDSEAERIAAHDRARQLGYKILTREVFGNEGSYHVKRVK